ncbi:MAG: acylphosphatase [bacterium]
MNDIIRKRIRFYGWVQGVGFRYRARHAASLYGATGWVRNESDGSVTMEIQGTPSQIEQVLQAIERGRYIDIERMETTSLPIDPEERSFHTR